MINLDKEHTRILDGKEGRLLQAAMQDMVKYAEAVGAREFVSISSAHTFFQSPIGAAQFFPPRHVWLTTQQVEDFCAELADLRVRARTTIDPGFLDLDRWQIMGGTEACSRGVQKVMEICRRTGILANWTCIPYLQDNIPLRGEHCSWSESSALIYCNSMLGARTNRDPAELSFFAAFLGIAPNWGMHLQENRKGTHLIDVQCELKSSTDWGALGYFAGEAAGGGIPVLLNLPWPRTEQAMQMGAAINVPGGAPMYHIVGVTPEAPTLEAALQGGTPLGTYVFDEDAKKKVFQKVSPKIPGRVSMVYFGCPQATLTEIEEISRLLEGRRVAPGTRLWVTTTQAIRAAAQRQGYNRIIEEAGGEVLADGCPLTYYVYSDSAPPDLGYFVTNSFKQGLGARRSFGSQVLLADTTGCIEIALKGEV